MISRNLREGCSCRLYRKGEDRAKIMDREHNTVQYGPFWLAQTCPLPERQDSLEVMSMRFALQQKL